LGRYHADRARLKLALRETLTLHAFVAVVMVGQTELVAMEEKIKVIEEAVEAEKSQGALRDLSQKELEDKMAVCREELEEAKAAKEFAKCIDLQVCYLQYGTGSIAQ